MQIHQKTKEVIAAILNILYILLYTSILGCVPPIPPSPCLPQQAPMIHNIPKGYTDSTSV